MLNNKCTLLYFVAVLAIASFVCVQTFSFASPVSPPEVSVQITRDYCPSMEIQAGMQIAWTNLDSADRALIIEGSREDGSSVSFGGTNLLEAGDVYSIALNKAGEYTYYCSKDRSTSGTITVTQKIMGYQESAPLK
jgi:plastocyanin